ncbi:hypothetical protein LCGC14_1519300 [marine sediment metagenome]|uniref:Uncharacterized protein n=1 Tax=marine sediment metagenome TaxID=412755 RepID=A0A0F9LEP9_9ZZZZ
MTNNLKTFLIFDIFGFPGCDLPNTPRPKNGVIKVIGNNHYQVVKDYYNKNFSDDFWHQCKKVSDTDHPAAKYVGNDTGGVFCLVVQLD